MIVRFVILLLSLCAISCASTKRAVEVDRTASVSTEIAKSEDVATQAAISEHSEWVKVTEIVEKITEPVVSHTIDAPIIAPDRQPSNPPRASPSRTIERTTRTIEGSTRDVQQVIAQHTADTTAIRQETAIDEQVEFAEERENSISKSLQWIAVIALCIVAIYLLNFLKKLKR